MVVKIRKRERKEGREGDVDDRQGEELAGKHPPEPRRPDPQIYRRNKGKPAYIIWRALLPKYRIVRKREWTWMREFVANKRDEEVLK
jgi:hypothetical protein